MPMHMFAFVGVVVAVILLPGPDTAVVTRNAIVRGRDAALGSALGVNVGLAVWTVATALGVAALLRSSSTVYGWLKLVGALYLIFIGAKTLWESRAKRDQLAGPPVSNGTGRRTGSFLGGLRQGCLSNLTNPKVGIFFTSLLPQFVSPSSPALPQMLLLGGIFLALNVPWMCLYGQTAARMSHILGRGRVKATVDGVSGLVLIGVGFVLAAER